MPTKTPTHPFHSIIIFADGASSGNPGPGGWGAIIATPEGHVTELGGGAHSTTNNAMELTAVIRAIEKIHGHPGGATVYTDSVYVIRGITQWIWGWRKNGWKTSEGADVANQDLWKKLSGELAKRGKENKVEWKYVRGHSGVAGNERVDEIAVAFSKSKRLALYDGSLLAYDIPLHDVPESEGAGLPDAKPRTEPKAAAFSYLSCVGNTVMRHSTWAECERRVKGRSGAKFKKAMSAGQEEEIAKSWGFRPEDIKTGA